LLHVTQRFFIRHEAHPPIHLLHVSEIINI